ncbi:nitrate/nitrite transporter [Frigoriglobus tundricola]|uniref:Nitrate/nitrite transporter NarK/U 1 n=1 Tax=Frigoriglobus tundricola TaxID=2774151 RepID=A0A6M5YTH7_9BACT|nr:MFS transporter [Frigoriglobus tundricola]QJW97397.1 Nitrate/nitrite transporter NarK/U 1 [Frigoriglobus tundricola]
MTVGSTSHAAPDAGRRARVLALSTAAFTLLFAVWLMLGMLSIKIKPELGLTDGQLYNLTIAAILAGSLGRFHFGIWTDRYGGRRVMTALLLFTVLPTLLVSRATSFEELLACALLYGVAGNSFTVGIAWNAAWYPKERQGLALGVFGAGNVGASVTKLIGPLLIAAVPAAGFFGGLVPGGWRFVPVAYAVLLVLMAAAVWFGTPRADRTPARGRAFSELVAPMKHAKVWEYCLQYAVVFGAYVALSGVLPLYYFTNYGAGLAASLGLNEQLVAEFDTIRGLKGDAHAAYLAAHPAVKTDLDYLSKWIGLLAAVCYIFPASLLRPVGGWLSDRYGARVVTAGVFWAMLASGAVLSLPLGLGVWAFTAALFVLGVGMGIGKASVYKMIPEHFPREVGSVGGLVGMLGALGGVLLPLAWAAVPGSTFPALLALTTVSGLWFAAGTVTDRKPKPVPETVAVS